LNFDPFPQAGRASFQGIRPEFVLQTFKTQNDARGDLHHTRSSDSSRHGLQKPEIA
jgi:hypothetical protein